MNCSGTNLRASLRAWAESQTDDPVGGSAFLEHALAHWVQGLAPG